MSALYLADKKPEPVVRHPWIHTLLLLFIPLINGWTQGTTWESARLNKRGSLLVTWYTSRPFIGMTPDGSITGIEYDILMDFRDYLWEAHGVDLDIQWKENLSFLGVYESIRNTQAPGMLGVSAFSITPERELEVAFAPPYMADISVLISSQDLPVVQDVTEFAKVFNNLTAVTIEGTTYAEDLERLKTEYKLNFTIEYIPSSHNILQSIESRKNAFGFIDLPIYLTEFSRNSGIKVRRQNLFPIKRTGYSFILPKGSDWHIPFEEYMHGEEFQNRSGEIIGRYIDRSLYEFIRHVYETADQNVVLLNKEKEIQNEALQGKTEQILKETTLRNYLIAGVVVVLTCLVIITRLYMVRNRSARLLRIQARRLSDLNQEKNHLIRILAHDLRTPINQMAGLAQILLHERERLSDTQKEVAANIQSASARLAAMIAKVLDVDAIEKKKASVDLENIQIATCVQETVSRFRPEAERKGIVLEHTLRQVPEICADAIYLAQIVDNLVSNAIKFSSPGGRVLISLTPGLNTVELSVHDEGPGFTDKDKQLLFRKFQTLSARPTAGESSTGLGLSIVKKYVDLMGATMRLESEPGKGSTFTVTFPV
jgi:signal transduction histidine kinase